MNEIEIRTVWTRYTTVYRTGFLTSVCLIGSNLICFYLRLNALARDCMHCRAAATPLVVSKNLAPINANDCVAKRWWRLILAVSPAPDACTSLFTGILFPESRSVLRRGTRCVQIHVWHVVFVAIDTSKLIDILRSIAHAICPGDTIDVPRSLSKMVYNQSALARRIWDRSSTLDASADGKRTEWTVRWPLNQERYLVGVSVGFRIKFG